MYVLGVNSTVTKHSDYFVWKDTSERVIRRCDVTVDKKQVNSCVLTTSLFGGSWATTKMAQRNRKCSIRLATNVKFWKFGGEAGKKKRFFENRVLINELIRMNSVQKILRSCFSSLLDSEMKLLVWCGRVSLGCRQRFLFTAGKNLHPAGKNYFESWSVPQAIRPIWESGTQAIRPTPQEVVPTRERKDAALERDYGATEGSEVLQGNR